LQSIEAKTDLTVIVEQKDLEDILKDYNEFMKRKNSISEISKQFHKQLSDQLEEFHFPSIKRLLVKNNSINDDEDLQCKHCNSFTGKNKGSLSAHIRNCKANNKNNNNNETKTNNGIKKMIID
jgi:hypothetical protein